MKNIQSASILVFILIFTPLIRAQLEKSNIDTQASPISQIGTLQQEYNINEDKKKSSDHHVFNTNYSLTTTKQALGAFNQYREENVSLDESQSRNYDRDSVTVYADHDNGLFGRSFYRTLLMTTMGDLFKRTDTYYVDKEVGSYLTAVVLQGKTVDLLRKMMLGKQSLYLGVYEINIDTMLMNFSRLGSVQNAIYKFKNNSLQLNMSFSIEKAPQELIEIVEQFYVNDPSIRKLIVDYYKSNYIIRIHSAENFVDPWNHDISMNEALVMATYLGNLEQPLWGIASGNACLAHALSIREKVG